MLGKREIDKKNFIPLMKKIPGIFWNYIKIPERYLINERTVRRRKTNKEKAIRKSKLYE